MLNLFSGSAEHGLLDVCVHATQGVISPGDALQVAKRPVLVTHHLLHHGRVPGKLHRLRGTQEERRRSQLESPINGFYCTSELPLGGGGVFGRAEPPPVTCLMSSGLLSMWEISGLRSISCCI